MTGSFGISCFCIRCVASREEARVDFYLGKSDKSENKSAYDYLMSYKDEIEDALKIPLLWNRADKYKASWVSYSLKNVSIANEADWSRMAKFLAEWSKKYLDVILPILQERYGENAPDDIKKQTIFNLAKRWAEAKTVDGLIQADIGHSYRSHIRFKTQEMSTLFPDTEELSDWGTPNHYFFEIVNRTGHSAYIQMCLNSKNLSADQKVLYDRVVEWFNSKKKVDGWKWRIIFRSATVDFDEDLSEQDVTKKLDTALDDVIQKQDDFLEKMKLSDSLLKQIKAVKH